MKRKPKYLLLSEQMGNGDTLEELADKARKIIDATNIIIPPIKQVTLDSFICPMCYKTNSVRDNRLMCPCGFDGIIGENGMVSLSCEYRQKLMEGDAKKEESYE